MKKIFPAAVLFPLLFCSCGRDVPPPPVERNDLVVRFFRSLRSGDGDTAAMQGAKLYALENRNYFLLRLVAVQQANSYILKAQHLLNTGRLEQAIRTLEAGLKRYPENGKLHRELAALRKLRHAETLFQAIRSAPNPTAMNAALIAARAGLDGVDSPVLTAFFDRCAKNMERWNRLQIRESPGEITVPVRSFDDK